MTLCVTDGTEEFNLDVVRNVLDRMGGDEVIFAHYESGALCLSWSRNTNGRVYSIYGTIPMEWLKNVDGLHDVGRAAMDYVKCIRGSSSR